MTDFFTRRAFWWSLLVVAVVYLVTFALMSPKGLWIVDNENRFLQTKALADNGFREYNIPWSGKAMDPQLRFSPLLFNPQGTFKKQKDGQLISVFQPAFMVISSIFYKVLGYPGLYVLPLGAALLMLWGCARLAGLLYEGKMVSHLAVLLAGLATPVWFYSQTFWEHTTAACLVVWGLLFVMRHHRQESWRDLALGFSFLALSLFFRDVLGLLAMVVLGLLLMRRPQAWLRSIGVAGAVLVVGVGLLMAFQGVTTGLPLGFHAGTLAGTESGVGGHLSHRPLLFYLFFCSAHPSKTVSVMLALPFLLAYLWRPRFARETFQKVVPWWAVAALVAGVVFLIALWSSPNIMRHLLAAGGLFLAAPVLVLGFLGVKEKTAARLLDRGSGFLVSTIALYLLVYCLVVPLEGAMSLHWGARPVFVLYPLLAVTAAGTLARWIRAGGLKMRWAGASVAMLIMVSILAQGQAVHLLHQKKVFSLQLAETLARFPHKVVVTNIFWLGHEMYDLFDEKTVFFFKDSSELNKLVPKIGARGHREALLVTPPQGPNPPPGVVRLNDEKWGFYGLDISVLAISGRK